jgi:hypothetical protein
MNQVHYDKFKNYSTSVSISSLFFVVFLFIFNFLLMKMLISIVILRYRTIRSIKLLEIQARSKVIGEDTKKVRKKWYNLLFCKRPKRMHVI